MYTTVVFRSPIDNAVPNPVGAFENATNIQLTNIKDKREPIGSRFNQSARLDINFALREGSGIPEVQG